MGGHSPQKNKFVSYRGLNEHLSKIYATASGDEFVKMINPNPALAWKMIGDLNHKLYDANNITINFKAMESLIRIPDYLRKVRVNNCPTWVPAAINDNIKIGISTAWDLMPRAQREFVNTIMTRSGVHKSDGDVHFIQKLKDVSDAVLTGRDSLGPDWKYAAYWHTVCGVYGTTVLGNDDEMILDLKSFVTPKNHGDDWDDKFDYFSNNVIRQMVTRPLVDAISYYDFVIGRKFWATPGSHSGVLGKSKFIKTKWNIAINMSDADLWKLANDNNGENAVWHKAFIKQERVWRNVPRLVINSPFTLYLRMAYIGHLFKQVAHTTLSPSLCGGLQKIVKRVLQISTQNATDQGQFDHNVRIKNVMSMINNMVNVLTGFINIVDTDLAASVISIEQMLSKAYVTLNKPGVNVKFFIKNGLMSGWYLTSIFGSIFNLTQISIIRDDIDMPLSDFESVLGDDYIGGVHAFGDGVDIWRAYMDRAFNIKSSSMLGSQGEFLRYLFDSKNQIIYGYPIRAVGALVYMQDPPMTGTTQRGKLSEVVNNYVMLISRGMMRNKCINYMLREIKNITHWSQEEAIDWLCSPASIGGGGFVGLGLRFKTYNLDSDLILPRGNIEPSSSDVKNRIPTEYQQQYLRTWLRYKDRDEYYKTEFVAKPGRHFEYKPQHIDNKGTFPLSAVYKQEFECKVESDALLLEWIKNGDKHKIEEVLDPTYLEFFRRVWSKSSRRVIIMWCLKRIAPVTPKDPKFNQSLYIDDANKRLGSALKWAFMDHTHVRFSHIYAAVLDVEMTQRLSYTPDVLMTW